MEGLRRTHRYDDIIDLPHHKSEKYPKMSMHDRAAQFSPFAALTGHSDAIKETARLTDRRMELDDDTIALLDDKLRIIEECAGEKEVLITYFKPDGLKEGGEYVAFCGKVWRIDRYKRSIVMADGTVIPTSEVIEIEF